MLSKSSARNSFCKTVQCVHYFVLVLQAKLSWPDWQNCSFQLQIQLFQSSKKYTFLCIYQIENTGRGNIWKSLFYNITTTLQSTPYTFVYAFSIIVIWLFKCVYLTLLTQEDITVDLDWTNTLTDIVSNTNSRSMY